MLKYQTPHLLFFIIFCTISSLQLAAQEVYGIVKDAETDLPIEGASVYFDNTAIGCSTNIDGHFKMKYDESIKSSLIISFIGYKTIILRDFDVEVEMEIFLFENEDLLDEVVIYANDDWTREEKLKEFRKHYLGESDNGKASKIINEEDIILRYDNKNKQLWATAKTPIFIKNRNLKYEVIVELTRFEINYNFVSKNKKRFSIDYVYYEGSSFFKSLQEDPTSNTQAKRNEAYKGSVLHFMRALSQEKLIENGYSIYNGNTIVGPSKYISVIKSEHQNGVHVKIPERLNIRDTNGHQSSVESFVDVFYIDHFGNHSPPEHVRFGGYLGGQRMGDALPLDFIMIESEL